ncbi:MAG: amidase [Deltaproteobacteria bacterium]|nr:amidase [Deltaproteobacteria bacterium]
MLPHELTAAEAVPLLARGNLTAEALVRACLERIAAEEPRVQAWEHLDAGLALSRARQADAAGRPGPLHGLPVGVKDVIDTADMPTARGSPLFAGRRPAADAACVAALRRAGAVVLGKTVTTELAYYAPGKTRNPHDPARTPGGSSSGSAAAVAACMVPAALGTQTAGSTIRPASFCGVVGLKPSHGLVSLEGVSPFAPVTLDTIGLFTRSARDLPLLLAALGAPILGAQVPARPRIGVARTEAWPLAGQASREAVARAARALAAAGAEVEDAPDDWTGLSEAQRTVMAFEAAAAWGETAAREGARLSPQFREIVAAGAAVAPAAYREARALAAAARARLPAVFARFDVLLGASALGEAPPGLGATGDPAMNRIWTLLGLPCLSLPAGRGPAGMPVGVQLVGPPGGDELLVAAGRWAEAALAGC